MSMIGNFLQVTPQELEALLSNPDSVVGFLYPEDEPHPKLLDIDKAWQAIHFVLTKSAWAGNPPLANMVLGGSEIGDDVGYGPARYITADQVKDVVNAIEEIDAGEFARRFKRQELCSHEIYPDIWGDDNEEEDDDLLEYVLSYYLALAKYYEATAGNGNAMVKFLN